MKLPIGLLFVLTVLLSMTNSLSAQEATPPPLDAKLRVKIGTKLEPSAQFLLPGTVDQSFENSEYRYAILDKDGNQVDDALIFKEPHRTINLPKSERSVTDSTDATIRVDKLTKGEEYYFVLSVRNLTGLAKFKVP